MTMNSNIRHTNERRTFIFANDSIETICCSLCDFLPKNDEVLPAAKETNILKFPGISHPQDLNLDNIKTKVE